MAIRRSAKFRFDYFLRGLPMELVARRCEHLMRAAEKEVDHLEKKAREEAGLPVEAEGGAELPPIELISYRDMQRKLRQKKKIETQKEQEQLEQKVEEIEVEMRKIQERLKELSKDVSEEQKENKTRNGIISRKRNHEEDNKGAAEEEKVATVNVDESRGAMGPDGGFVEFPEYDGIEPLKEAKKAFTHFCVSNRKEVKASLDPADRKNKAMVNEILRDRWLSLPDEEKQTWRTWATWDKKRYARDLGIYEKAQKSQNERITPAPDEDTMEKIHVPKKRSASTSEGDGGLPLDHIPKKKRR